MRRILLLPVLIFVLQIQLSAQQRQFDRPMQLIKCSIDIKANLFTATTFIEMEFYNDNKQEIEGLYTFQLKPEQMITGFQLDLNGKYRDGSIEEKWKARNAYNSIVGKRVDPALLTMNGIGQYSLNISPVPAKGNRKITMTIKQLLRVEGNELVYQLPLNIQHIVKDFKLTISAGSKENIPTVERGLIGEKEFYSSPGVYALLWETEDIYLQKPISFSIPLTASPVVCTRSSGKETAFALRFQPASSAEFDIHPERITVFWDASASTKSRDINKEINFLKQFVSFHKIKQLTIIPFNHKLIDTAIFYTGAGFNSRWDQYLRDMKYDGATQLGKIDLTNYQSDIFFLFTDGKNSYGKPDPITGTAQVYCVHSSLDANQAALQKITGASGGKIINLNSVFLSNAISINNKGENWVMSITSSNGKTIIDQALPGRITKNIFINGIMFGGDDTLIIKYGHNNKVMNTQRIYLAANQNCPDAAIERIQSLKRFQELLYSYNWEDVLEFGLKEKAVTLYTAFIVLEKVEDYIKYNIAPPKELEKECEELQYVKKDTRQQRRQLTMAEDFDVLDLTVANYNQRIKKWDDKASPINLTRAEFANTQSRMIENNDLTSQKPASPNIPVSDFNFGGASNLSEVVVVGYGTQQKRSLGYSVSTVRSNDLSQGWTSVESALAGKVSGLSVNSNEQFAKGSQSNIRIRGAGSLNGGGEPLFILDGTPFSGNINDLVNVNDIENISVLKDAQATALFGSRAYNGAIVINTKKKNRNWYSYYNDKMYRLKNMEDVDYLKNIKDVMDSEKYEVYKQLQGEHGSTPTFYFDIAQHFFEIGLKAEALEVLMNAAEESQGNLQTLRAIGFVFENWKMFDKAIEIYGSLVENYPKYPDVRRDLALAYYQNGEHQKAVDIFYEAIKENVFVNESWKISLKATMLNELNAIIALHKDLLDISAIPPSLIRPLTADLRIVLDGNGGSFNNFSIKEPTGDICSYTKPVTKTGVMLTDNNYSYYAAPVEYMAKNAKEGKYRICVNYYYYNSWRDKAPSFIRVITFRNFGKPGQSMEVRNVIMDNQYGDIEIDEVKW